MGNFSPDQLNALERLINYTNTAEGSVLPPQLVGGVRIPSVTNLQVVKTVPAVGGSLCTLTWTDVEDGRNLVDHYDVSAIGLLNGNTQPLNLVHSDNSPCSLTIQGDKAQPVVFVVQTVLKNGMTSEFSQSPSCGCFCAAPLITTQFVGQQAITGYNITNANFFNLVDNPSFEQGDNGTWRKVGHALGASPIDPPAINDSGWSIVDDSANSRSGSHYAKHVASSYSNDDLISIGNIQCGPADIFLVSAYLKTTGGADGTAQLGIQFYDHNGIFVANSVIGVSSSGSYTKSVVLTNSGGGTGAAAATQARIILDLANHTTGIWYVDDVSCTLLTTGTVLSSSLTAQSTSLSPTNFSPTLVNGMYRISFYLDVNTTGTGNVFATLSWVDNIGTKTAATGTLSLASAANQVNNDFFIRVASSSPSFTTTYAATGKYDIYFVVERLGD